MNVSEVPQLQTITAVKTAVFKIHNPSKRKQAMLNYALLQNHLAYTKALKKHDSLIKSLVDDELKLRTVEDALDKKVVGKQRRERKFERERRLGFELNTTLKPLPIASASKAARSIAGAIIGQIESHIELHNQQETVGLPTVQSLRPQQLQYGEALKRLGQSIKLEDENAARDDLARLAKAGDYRPLLYVGNRIHDGFLLLKDDNTKRFYVWLNLFPETSRFAKLTRAERQVKSCRRVSNLIDMRTGEVISFASKTGCLFPIEYGADFQRDEFLQKGSPLSAKLMKRGDRYEVHISFEYETPKIVPVTRLGVDRGIYNLASLSVIDDDGRIIEQKNVDGRDLRFVQKKIERRQRIRQQRGKRFSGRAKLHASDEAVHRTANEIVALAAKHKSQIIIEDLSRLTSRKGKRKRSNFNRVLNRSQYQKLEHVLEYKLSIAGLPKPKTVHAGYTSQACPLCGHIDSANRHKIPEHDGFRMHEFKCVNCGYTDDADLNASRIIALKRLWRENLPSDMKSKLFKEVPENKNFSTFLRVRAERRDECACDRKVGSFGRAGLDAQYEDGEVAPSGNADEPRSGSNTPAGKNSPTMQSAVSPSDKNLRLQSLKKDVTPDG